MRILIAEDNPVSSRVLATTLTKWGHDVVATDNGLEAWATLQKDDAPRLAILDWMIRLCIITNVVRSRALVHRRCPVSRGFASGK
jgi:CheY-like chemotaxis protein